MPFLPLSTSLLPLLDPISKNLVIDPISKILFIDPISKILVSTPISKILLIDLIWNKGNREAFLRLRGELSRAEW